MTIFPDFAPYIPRYLAQAHKLAWQLILPICAVSSLAVNEIWRKTCSTLSLLAQPGKPLSQRQDLRFTNIGPRN